MNPNKKNTRKEKQSGSEKKNIPNYIILSCILILTFFLYSNSLNNDLLHFDDTEYFSAHSDIIHLSWQSLKTYFSSYYLLMYQPLPVLTFAIQFFFTGLHSFPLHFVNLCLHLINILLVFQFIKLLSKDKNVALLIALIFAIHPMNVEAVSWISARSSGMYTLFYLCSLIYYTKYITQKHKAHYFLLAIVFFLFSLFSKSQAVTLPLILLLIDYLNKRKIVTGKVILEKIPFFILSGIFAWITISNPGTRTIMEKGMIAAYSPLDNFFLACYSIVFYVVKFAVPVNLCGAYVFPPKSGALLGWEYYLSPLLLVIAGFFLYKERRNKWMKFGAALFLLGISLNIQIIPSRLVIVADRYAYFPYLGLSIILVSYFRRMYAENTQFFYKYRVAGICLCILYIVFFSLALVIRNKTWKNDDVFMSDMIAKNPEVPYLYRAYGTRGNYLKKHNRPEEALRDYTKAIELKPDNSSVYANRAFLNMDKQDYNAVISDADNAIKFNFRSPAIFQIRAIAKYYKNDWAGALADCDQCLKMDPSMNQIKDLRTAILDSLKKNPGR
jgi:hypothetical protein